MCIFRLGENGLIKYRLAKKWEQFKIVLLFMDHPVFNAVHRGADLDVYMAVVAEAEQGVIGHHPLVVQLPPAVLHHLPAVVGPASPVLWVDPVFPPVGHGGERLRKPLGAAAIQHAGRCRSRLATLVVYHAGQHDLLQPRRLRRPPGPTAPPR